MNTEIHMNGQYKGHAAHFAEYYVYQDDGKHIGPITPELVAKSILAGNLEANALVGLAGGAVWQPAGSADPVKRELQRLSSIPPAMAVVNTQPSAVVNLAPASALPSTKPATPSVPPPVPQPVATAAPKPATPVASTTPTVAPAAAQPAKPASSPATPAPAAKADPPKPALDPKYKMLPLVIFGACGALGSVMTVVKLIVG